MRFANIFIPTLTGDPCRSSEPYPDAPRRTLYLSSTRKTGRWSEIGDEMFRLKDRGGRDMCLGMTHEEIITWLALMEIRSYRDLPRIW